MKDSCRNILLCEGPEDRHFFEALFRVHELPQFRILDNTSEKDRRGGITKFRSRLEGLKVKDKKRFESIRNFIIVADNDINPSANFEQVRQQIDMVFPGKAPDRAWEKTKYSPCTAVIMIPKPNEQGNLELLCIESLRAKHREIASYVDDILSYARADLWDTPRRGKAWLRTNLALRSNDPCASFGEILRDETDLFEMKDTSLLEIVNFIKLFND